MKASKSRIKNAIAKAEKRKAGKPLISKYALKNRPPKAPAKEGDAR